LQPCFNNAQTKSPQTSFFTSGSTSMTGLFLKTTFSEKSMPVVDFSFVNDLVKDGSTPEFGHPAEDHEFMLRRFDAGIIVGFVV